MQNGRRRRAARRAAQDFLIRSRAWSKVELLLLVVGAEGAVSSRACRSLIEGRRREAYRKGLIRGQEHGARAASNTALLIPPLRKTLERHIV